jgi:hypothetical protein
MNLLAALDCQNHRARDLVFGSRRIIQADLISGGFLPHDWLSQ